MGLGWGLRLGISSNLPGEGDTGAAGLGTPLEKHSVWWSLSGRRGRGGAGRSSPALLPSFTSGHWPPLPLNALFFCFFSLIGFLLLKKKF